MEVCGDKQCRSAEKKKEAKHRGKLLQQAYPGVFSIDDKLLSFFVIGPALDSMDGVTRLKTPRDEAFIYWAPKEITASPKRSAIACASAGWKALPWPET